MLCKYRRQKGDSNDQKGIKTPFAGRPLVKPEPNNRDAYSSSAHVCDKVGVRSERTECVMQASVQYKACDYASQESIPLGLCLNTSKEPVQRHAGEYLQGE